MTKNSLFLSKGPLLKWLNETLDVKLDKIEQCAAGAVYCQLLHLVDPKCIKIKKVNFQATEQNNLEAMRNWNYVQEALHKLHVKKAIPVDRLLKGRFQDNLEFLQWFHKFFQESDASAQVKSYNPQRERLKSKGGKIFGSPLMKAKHRSLSKRRPTKAKRHLRYATVGGSGNPVNHLTIQKRNWPGNSRSYSRSPDSPTPPVSPNVKTRSSEKERSRIELLQQLEELETLEEQLKTNIEEQKNEKQKLFEILYRVQTEWQPKTDFEAELHQLFFEDSDLHIEGPLNCNRFVYFPPQLNFDDSKETDAQLAPDDDCLMEDLTLLPPSSDGSPSQNFSSPTTDQVPDISVEPSVGLLEFPDTSNSQFGENAIARMRSKGEVQPFQNRSASPCKISLTPNRLSPSIQSDIDFTQETNHAKSDDEADAAEMLPPEDLNLVKFATLTTTSSIQSVSSEQNIRNELEKIEHSFNKQSNYSSDLVKMKSAPMTLGDIFGEVDSNKKIPSQNRVHSPKHDWMDEELENMRFSSALVGDSFDDL